jgi:hypothetical protein
MTDEPEAPPQAPTHEDTEVESYEAMQAEVDKHFEGSWERFLKAVENASEVLHFVLTHHCATDAAKFEAWAKEKQLPPGWVPRFYMTLTPDGQLKA